MPSVIERIGYRLGDTGTICAWFGFSSMPIHTFSEIQRSMNSTDSHTLVVIVFVSQSFSAFMQILLYRGMLEQERHTLAVVCSPASLGEL